MTMTFDARGRVSPATGGSPRRSPRSSPSPRDVTPAPPAVDRAMSTQVKMAPGAVCPWSKSHVKRLVKMALAPVGGHRGFEFVGRAVQEAIIAQAAWNALRVAASVNTVAVTAEMMWAIESAFRIAAGMTDEE